MTTLSTVAASSTAPTTAAQPGCHESCWLQGVCDLTQSLRKTFGIVRSRYGTPGRRLSWRNNWAATIIRLEVREWRAPTGVVEFLEVVRALSLDAAWIIVDLGRRLRDKGFCRREVS